MTANIFVSYSHRDSHLIGPVVSLLRLNAGSVFHDVDSLVPGKKWRGQIDDNLDRAQLVVLFWCVHASESPEVAREYTTAMRAGKDILPVLLDDTALPEGVSEFQWIDFRALVHYSHEDELPRPASPNDSQGDLPESAPVDPQPAPPITINRPMEMDTSLSRFSDLLLKLTLGLGVLSMGYYLVSLLTDVFSFTWIWVVLGMVGVSLVVFRLTGWLRMRAKAPMPSPPDLPDTGEISAFQPSPSPAWMMAGRLQGEINRRLARLDVE